MKRLVCSAFLICVGLVGVALFLGGCETAHLAQPGYQDSQTGGQPAIPGAMPSPDEELWIIGRDRTPAPRGDDVPGGGSLLAKTGPQTTVPLPLRHTDVRARVDGYIASVDVTQQYHNPFDVKIEAVYVFPLPHNAAVSDFVMTIGSRRIRGIIRDRQEAQRIYEHARSQGYVASLLTQERPNIFTQSVANIEPGRQVDVSIRYFHTLEYVDGWYEWVFPMVVGPRFNPPGTTDGVGAVGRGSRGASGQTSEVTYLRPGERSGHDIALNVAVDAAVGIERIESRNHRASITHAGPGRATVKLDPSDALPNKDFVLRIKVAGDRVKSGMLTSVDQKGRGYFALMLYPPEQMMDLPRRPLEMVFVVDVSGSMTGPPIEQAKAAVRWALRNMNPSDTFQVITFAGAANAMASRPLPATAANVRRGLEFLEQAQAGGGTMMIEGIKAALSFPRDPSRPRFVAFLTDGYIGNEREILRSLHAQLSDSRVFSFGVGSSPNRYLLDQMARVGRGAVAYLSLNDNADAVMSLYFQRVAHPAMGEISLDFGSARVADVYPALSDLYVGRPVIVTGRFDGAPPRTIHVSGTVGDRRVRMNVPASPIENAQATHALPAVWARHKIADLCARGMWEDAHELDSQVKALALEYGLMSAYTAFVAVDTTARTAGDHGVSVPVPVNIPDGVRYDTTVTEDGSRRKSSRE